MYIWHIYREGSIRFDQYQEMVFVAESEQDVLDYIEKHMWGWDIREDEEVYCVKVGTPLKQYMVTT